jgi:hypothetical protein
MEAAMNAIIFALAIVLIVVFVPMSLLPVLFNKKDYEDSQVVFRQ